jgi:hypothetical protein
VKCPEYILSLICLGWGRFITYSMWIPLLVLVAQFWPVDESTCIACFQFCYFGIKFARYISFSLASFPRRFGPNLLLTTPVSTEVICHFQSRFRARGYGRGEESPVGTCLGVSAISYRQSHQSINMKTAMDGMLNGCP